MTEFFYFKGTKQSLQEFITSMHGNNFNPECRKGLFVNYVMLWEGEVSGFSDTPYILKNKNTSKNPCDRGEGV